ncbi:hypothetical protein KAH55_10290, partial [bacterium]|nr:hypothetical protein [bacterium]
MTEDKKDFTEPTLHDYIDIILRRRWIVIVVFVLVFSASLYYALTRPPVYESQATFIIENNEPMLPMLENVRMSERSRPFEFYEAVVGSRLFQEKAAREIVVELADSADMYLTIDEAKLLVFESISLSNPAYADFVGLHSQANDPRVAYTLCTIAARTLKERCQEIDREESMNVVQFVEQQKNNAQHDLESSEKQLQQFREENDALSASADGGLVSDLIGYQTELLNIRTQRELSEKNVIEYRRQLKQIDSRVNESLDRTEIPETIALRREIEDLENLRNGLVQVTGKSDEISRLEDRIMKKKRDLIR